MNRAASHRRPWLADHGDVNGLTTPLHEERLQTVTNFVAATGARSVLDLGCGEGELLVRLAARTQFERIVGIDISAAAVEIARRLVRGVPFAPEGRVEVLQASFTEVDPRLYGFDAAVMLETIEHIDPGRLGLVEHAVFGCYRPGTVLITTPNQEYNAVHGMGPGEFRHPDHRFEWCRARFRRWAYGIAERNGYSVTFQDVGDDHPVHGASTQMARFALGSDEGAPQRSEG